MLLIQSKILKDIIWLFKNTIGSRLRETFLFSSEDDRAEPEVGEVGQAAEKFADPGKDVCVGRWLLGFFNNWGRWGNRNRREEVEEQEDLVTQEEVEVVVEEEVEVEAVVVEQEEVVAAVGVDSLRNCSQLLLLKIIIITIAVIF